MKNETFTPERIKAEADAFFEWDGEDRSLVTTTSCLLFAQHIAGLIQDRAAQPAPVVPVLPQRIPTHQERGINDPGWNACIDAMLSAAPAQGQQVECQECERLARQVKHWQDLSVANRNVADEALAELSVLKEQQVGQEPVAWRYTSAQSPLSRPEKKWHYQETFPKWDDRKVCEIGQLQALYTAPQPAPAQDVAGLVKRCMDEEAAHWTGDSRQAVRLALDDAYARVLIALAAHDKQSGGK